MPAPSLEELERILRRRTIFVGVSIAAVLVAIGGIAGLLGVVPFLTFLALGALVPTFLWIGAIRYWLPRNADALAALRPHIRDAGIPFGRGLMVVLDDGLLVWVLPYGVCCIRFLSASGAVVHPSLQEALRWVRVRGWTRRGMVRDRRGADPIRRELAALSARFGAGFASCLVHQAKAVPTDPRAPAWRVAVVFAAKMPGAPPRLAPVVQDLAQVEAFLRTGLNRFGPTTPT